MKRPYVITFLLLTTLLQNCDNSITISNQDSRYVAKIHLTAISPSEPLPGSVKNLLINEELIDKHPIKFPLAYFLIQAEDISVYYSSNFDKEIIAQLYLEISGTKYYKLFVHPDLDYTYSFLKHAYRYIGPEDTEFYGSPTSVEKTMVVWSKHQLTKKPFIVKTEIDERQLMPDQLRRPASAVTDVPETLQMLFYRPLRGNKEPIEGQQIIGIPDYSKASKSLPQ
jgi:hypothetical protein